MKYRTLFFNDHWTDGDEVSYENTPHIQREWFAVVPDYFGEYVGRLNGRRPIKEESQQVAEHGG